MACRNRLGRLKGYGNAINVQTAAVFISEIMAILGIAAESKI